MFQSLFSLAISMPLLFCLEGVKPAFILHPKQFWLLFLVALEPDRDFCYPSARVRSKMQSMHSSFSDESAALLSSSAFRYWVVSLDSLAGIFRTQRNRAKRWPRRLYSTFPNSNSRSFQVPAQPTYHFTSAHHRTVHHHLSPPLRHTLVG
jgi:hypothetical protein